MEVAVNSERWAQVIIERTLAVPVVIHDTGRHNSMYDLRVGPEDAPTIAIECVRAIDPDFIKTWKRGPAQGSLTMQVAGNWWVGITKQTMIKVLTPQLELLLRDLEDRGILHVTVDFRLKWQDLQLFMTLDALGITYVQCFEVQGSGNVWFGMPGIGGAVYDQGAEVAEWAGSFLRDPARKDVLFKLGQTDAVERHVFIIVAAFGDAPWAVQSYLSGDGIALPPTMPDLPSPVTGVWIVPNFGHRGVYWRDGMWHRCDLA